MPEQTFRRGVMLRSRKARGVISKPMKPCDFVVPKGSPFETNGDTTKKVNYHQHLLCLVKLF
jgi:hypothetical protein